MTLKPSDKNYALRIGIFVMLILGMSSFLAIPMMSSQNAMALSALTFSSQPTFTSLVSGKWQKVWTNTAGTSTYFADSSASSFKSVKMNNTSGAVQATVTAPLVGGGTTVTSTTGSTTKNDIIALQSLGGTTQALVTAGTTIMAEKLATSSAELVGQTVNELHVWLKKTCAGTCAGTATVAVMNNVGTTLYSFGTIDCNAGVTTAYVEYTFRGATTGRTLASGDYLGVFFNGGSAGNTCDVEYVAADRYDGTTNSIGATCTGVQGAAVCSDQTARELHFQVGFDYVAALANDNDGGASYWENAGYTVRAAQTDSDTTCLIAAASAQSINPTNFICAEKKTTSSVLANQNVDTIKLRMAKTGAPVGTFTVAEFSNTGSLTSKLNQATGTNQANVLNNVNFAYGEHLNSGAALIGQTANSITLGLLKTNSPVGTASLCVMDSSANCTYTFGTLDVAALTTGVLGYTFTNYASTYTFVLNDYIGIKYTGGSASNTVTVSGSTANVYDGTASAKALYTSSWAADTTTDLGSATASAAWELDLVVAPTILNTFGTMDASTLTATPTIYTFTAGSDFTLSGGATTFVGVMFTGNALASPCNCVDVQRTSVDAFDGTANSIVGTFNGNWADSTTLDIRFRLIDTPSEVADQESGAFIKWNAGSALGTGGVKVYWADNTKIPTTVKLSTSTDDAIYTDRVTLSPTQATGFEWILLDTSYTVQYVKMTVVTWGSAKSMAVGEYQRLPTSALTSKISSIETLSGVQTAYYASHLDAATTYIGIINLDTGRVTNSITASVTTITNALADMAITVTANKVYIARGSDNNSNGYYLTSWNRDLTTQTNIGSFVIGGGNNPFLLSMAVATDGVSAATDKIYVISTTKFVGATNGRTDVDKIVNGARTSLTNFGAYASGQNPSDPVLVMVSGIAIYHIVQAGTTKTYTVTVSSDTVSAQLYSSAWITYPRQAFDFDGITRTYKSVDGTGLYSAYFATSNYAIAYAANTGTLTDPFRLYIETVTPGTATVAGIASTFYRISDTLVVTGSGTTWTPKTFGGSTMTPNPYSERLGVALTSNSTLLNGSPAAGNSVFRIVCDASYSWPQANKIWVGSYSDCTKWRILATSSATVGRENWNPFTTTPDLVHTTVFTAYTFQISTTNPSDYVLKLVYDNKNVDIIQFDAGATAQARLLYGQCYNVFVDNVNTSAETSLGLACANDITTKTISLTTIVVPNDWVGTDWRCAVTRNFGTEPAPDPPITGMGNATIYINNTLVTADTQSAYNASVYYTDSWQPDHRTISTWYNFTNVTGEQSQFVNNVPNNQTRYFFVYSNGNPKLMCHTEGKSLFLTDPLGDKLGSIFGIGLPSFFAILVGAIFPKQYAVAGLIVLGACIGILYAAHLMPDLTSAILVEIVIATMVGVVYGVKKF